MSAQISSPSTLVAWPPATRRFPSRRVSGRSGSRRPTAACDACVFPARAPSWNERAAVGPAAEAHAAEAAQQLEEYAASVSGMRSTIELDWAGVEAGHRRALETLCEMAPFGTTVTYGELGHRAGVDDARDVGVMMARNPIPLVVPCHRVVASDGLGGYGGGLDLKRRLLELEGVLPPRLDLGLSVASRAMELVELGDERPARLARRSRLQQLRRAHRPRGDARGRRRRARRRRHVLRHRGGLRQRRRQRAVPRRGSRRAPRPGRSRHEVRLGARIGATARRSTSATRSTDSLERLRTDYVDLYYQHKPDPSTPIAETLSALDELVRDGKVRAIGCSNFSAEQLAEADRVARELGTARFTVLQNQYSLLERGDDEDVLPLCRELGVSYIPYFPLASGLLTGKYRRGEPAPTERGSRVARSRTSASTASRRSPHSRRSAATRCTSSRSSALASTPGIGSIIAGATKPEQVTRERSCGSLVAPRATTSSGRSRRSNNRLTKALTGRIRERSRGSSDNPETEGIPPKSYEGSRMMVRRRVQVAVVAVVVGALTVSGVAAAADRRAAADAGRSPRILRASRGDRAGAAGPDRRDPGDQERIRAKIASGELRPAQEARAKHALRKLEALQQELEEKLARVLALYEEKCT